MFELWIATWCWATTLMPNGSQPCIRQGFNVFNSSKAAIFRFNDPYFTSEFWLYHIKETPLEERHIIIPRKAVDETRPSNLNPRIKIRKKN